MEILGVHGQPTACSLDRDRAAAAERVRHSKGVPVRGVNCRIQEGSDQGMGSTRPPAEKGNRRRVNLTVALLRSDTLLQLLPVNAA